MFKRLRGAVSLVMASVMLAIGVNPSYAVETGLLPSSYVSQEELPIEADPAEPEYIETMEVPEAAASADVEVDSIVMTSGLTLTNDSTYPWTTTTYNSMTVAKPGNSGVNSSTSTMSFTFSGTGVFSFGCYTSTEKSFDKFIVALDGTTKYTLSDINDWQKLTVEVNTSGSHTLTIKYSKDSSAHSNEDTCYVGDVSFCQYAPESDFEFDSSTGTITGYTGSGGAIAIPSNIGGVAVTTIGDSAFWLCSNITSVIIPDSVASIGNFAFYFCSGLTSVTISNSVTSIGSSAFDNCLDLTSVTIPESVTSIGVFGAFGGCDKLTSINVETANTNYASLEGVLFNKEFTVLEQYPGGRTGAYEIPDSVTIIGNSAFSGCSGLTSVIIPESVTVIVHSAFSGCSRLTSVTIPKSVTSICSSAFSACYGLTSVTIEEGVTSIEDDAFYHCKSLTSISIPDSVTSIGSEILYGVDNATIYCVEGSTADDASLYPSSCTIKYISDESDFTFDSSTGTITDYTGSGGDVVIPSAIGGVAVTAIGEYAFNGRSTITSVTIPDGITSIGAYAFYACSGLTSITIPDGVTSIGEQAFRYCVGLTSVTIPGSVTSIEKNTFYNCSSLTSVIIQEGVTSIGNDAFAYCSRLTSVTIPDSVTSLGEFAFSGCSGLTSITIPDSVTSIESYAFDGCSGITSISLPSSVSSIGANPFTNCESLTNISVDENNPYFKSVDGVLYNKLQTTILICPVGITGSFSIPSGVTSVGAYAFYSCDDLTEVTIPNSVTSIGARAFCNCSGLTSVTIPDGVTNIGMGTFDHCIGLTSVTISNSVTSIGSDILYGVDNATIYCVEGSTADNASLYPGSCTIKYVIDEGAQAPSGGFIGQGTMDANIVNASMEAAGNYGVVDGAYLGAGFTAYNKGSEWAAKTNTYTYTDGTSTTGVFQIGKGNASIPADVSPGSILTSSSMIEKALQFDSAGSGTLTMYAGIGASGVASTNILLIDADTNRVIQSATIERDLSTSITTPVEFNIPRAGTYYILVPENVTSLNVALINVDITEDESTTETTTETTTKTTEVVTETETTTTTEISTEVSTYSEDTLVVKPVAPDAVKRNGQYVVDRKIGETFDVNFDCFNVENTPGVNNYTFFVTYDPSVVRMKGLVIPDDLSTYMTYPLAVGNTTVDMPIYVEKNNVANSIALTPAANEKNYADYADVITNDTPVTTTCGELGKVKFSNFINTSYNDELQVVCNSGTLMTLSFEVVGKGDPDIYVDLDYPTIDGFKTNPTSGMKLKFASIPSDMVVEELVPMYDDPIGEDLESTLWTTADGWYGTVFGDIGGTDKLYGQSLQINPETGLEEMMIDYNTLAIASTSESGETNFIVEGDENTARIKAGEILSNGNKNSYGKISSTTDGLAMYYMPTSDVNFEISADITINSYDNDQNQVAFGAIVADTILVNEFDRIKIHNWVSAGPLRFRGTASATDPDTSVFWSTFARLDGTLTAGTEESLDKLPKVGDTIHVSIVRNGQSYTCTFGDDTYTFKNVDTSGYVYAGFYVARCADISVSNITYDSGNIAEPTTETTTQITEAATETTTEKPAEGGIYPEDTLLVQPVAPDAVEQDGQNVVDREIGETFNVNIDCSNVENTPGVNNYTFFVTYDPSVVRMKRLVIPDDLSTYMTYPLAVGNVTVDMPIYSEASRVANSIALTPAADAKNYDDYADVITKDTLVTTTCGELGKVKFSNFLNTSYNDELLVAHNSGTLMTLSFEVVGKGNTDLYVDLDYPTIDGFKTKPTSDKVLKFASIPGNIVIGDVIPTQYTITYDANGGSSAPENVTVDYGVDSSISSILPVREGYEFLGWATNANATEAQYSAGDRYTENTDITLYAVWKEITYTISYNPNGGFGTPASVTKKYGETITLTYDCPQRINYIFAGWALTPMATEAQYQPGGEFDLNMDCTLYAVWQSEAAKTYTVTYDANGGTGAPEAQTKIEGVNLILSTDVPIREGYRFMGWTTSPTSQTIRYDTGDQYTNDASIILYAVWYEDIGEQVDYPRVITNAAQNVTENFARLTGTIDSDGGGSIKSARIIYYAKNNVGVRITTEAQISGNTIIADVRGLTPDTEYVYYAAATNERGGSSGASMEFKTSASSDPNTVTSITISPEAIALAVGESTDLIVSVLPATADDESKQYVWQSSNTDVVTVDPLSKTGNIKAVGEGEATITVTVASTKVKASCKVKVSAADDLTNLFNFSELNMASAMTKQNGLNGWNTTLKSGGNLNMVSAYLTRWSGILNENKFPYTDAASYTGSSFKSDIERVSDFHIQDIIYLPLRQNSLDNDEIKYAVMNYGAVYASIQYANDQTVNRPTYLCNREAYSSTNRKGNGHVVAIVGWDDNFWNEEFGIPSSQKGAFICKNSYGADEGDNGYIYVSYYDANIGIKERCAVFYGIESADNYRKVYQYDPLGPVQVMDFNDTTDSGSFYVSNVFPEAGTTLKSDEQLQAVSFYTYDMGTSYEVFIVPRFTGFDSLTLTDSYKVAEGIQPYAGYHTVNLKDKSVNLEAGTRFAVIIKLSTDSNGVGHYYVEANSNVTPATATYGDGYYSTDINAKSWVCLQSVTVNGESMEQADFCIKAFTNGDPDDQSVVGDSETDLPDDDTGISDIVVEVGDTVIEHFDESFIFPEKFDLRDEGLVSPVKDQGSYNTCWSFAATASLESSALRKYKLASADSDAIFDGAGDALMDIAVESIDIEGYSDRIIMAKDSGIQLNYTVEPFNATMDGVIWSSEDSSVATIDSQGYLRSYNIGTTRITVSTLDGNFSASIDVEVKEGSAVTGVAFNDAYDTKEVKVGDVFLLDYTVSKEDAVNKNVTWSSSNPDAVTVSKYGIIKAVGEGSAIITCRTDDGGFTDTMTINVEGDWNCQLTQTNNTFNNVPNIGIMMGSLGISVENTIGSTFDGIAILMVYDADGRFVYSANKAVTINEGTTEINFNDTLVTNSNCASYKVVIWNDLDSMMPLCAQLEGRIPNQS